MSFKETHEKITEFINAMYPQTSKVKETWHDPEMSQITIDDAIALGFIQKYGWLSLALCENVYLNFEQGYNEDGSIRYRNLELYAGLGVEYPANVNHLSIEQLKQLIQSFAQL